MIPHYYQHFCPVKILSGHNAVSNIPFEMDILGCRRAMVVTDKGVVDAGLINLVREAFADSDKEIGYVFDEVLPDSSNRLVNKLAKLFEKEKCDCFLAVGGGAPWTRQRGEYRDLRRHRRHSLAPGQRDHQKNCCP